MAGYDSPLSFNLYKIIRIGSTPFDHQDFKFLALYENQQRASIVAEKFNDVQFENIDPDDLTT